MSNNKAWLNLLGKWKTELNYIDRRGSGKSHQVDNEFDIRYKRSVKNKIWLTEPQWASTEEEQSEKESSPGRREENSKYRKHQSEQRYPRTRRDSDRRGKRHRDSNRERSSYKSRRRQSSSSSDSERSPTRRKNARDYSPRYHRPYPSSNPPPQGGYPPSNDPVLPLYNFPPGTYPPYNYDYYQQTPPQWMPSYPLQSLQGPTVPDVNTTSLPNLPSAAAPDLVPDTETTQEEELQTETLVKQRDEYIRRGLALNKELETLKQKELLTSEAEENEKLEVEINNKIKTVNNVIDVLTGIIGDERPASVTLEQKEQDKEGMCNYAYYDTEMHWCRVCDVFPRTAKEYLNHLHSKQHKESILERKLNNMPWHNLNIHREVPFYEGAPTKRTPIKGLQFFMPATAWFCKLCNVWIGDLHCASLHLKSKEHSTNYSNYTEQNPQWETDWMTDREKAYTNNSERLGRKQDEEQKQQEQQLGILKPEKEQSQQQYTTVLSPTNIKQELIEEPSHLLMPLVLPTCSSTNLEEEKKIPKKYVPIYLGLKNGMKSKKKRAKQRKIIKLIRAKQGLVDEGPLVYCMPQDSPCQDQTN